MRILVAVAAAFLLLPLAAADSFGTPGRLGFVEVVVPGDGAAEPTIGIPWNTDSVFFHSVNIGSLPDPQSLVSRTFRARFDEAGDPHWQEVTPPYQVPINLDPMLVTDPDTGRTWAGGLHGICSWMMYSDDDGATWLPTINMCSGPNFDHQSIGSGPPAGPLPSVEGGHVAYYCAQGGTISCARSLDGGTVWGPFQDVPGPCGGFHGHIRVSTVTGFAVIPTGDCGDEHGYISTADGGVTWQSNQIPGTEQWSNGFDPSMQFSRPGGWMYYAMASEHGVHVALSKDEGKTWEPLGAGMGVEPAAWLDVGQFHDPPVVSGAFTNLQAGDDDRVAIAFFGLEAPPGVDLDFLRSEDIYQCDDRQDELVWYPYVAVSYDAGSTWRVDRVSDDPVQVGGLYDVVVDGSGACRNLLDFNDMDIDSKGRIHFGIADGCVDACAEDPKPSGNGWRADEPRLFRQVAGRGLFAEFDLPSPFADVDQDGIVNNQDPDMDGDRIPNGSDPDIDGDGIANADDMDNDADGVDDASDTDASIVGVAPPKPPKESPGVGSLLLLATLAALALLRRR